VDGNEFAKLVRAGKDKLRVDRVVVIAGETKLRGQGILRIEPGTLEIDLTLVGRTIPDHSRVTTKKDAWSMSGVIEGVLPFNCDNVSPGGSNRSQNGILTITRRLHPIELVTASPDSPKSKHRRARLMRQLGFKPDKGKADRSFEFEATIVDCLLPAANARTTTTKNNEFLGESSSVALNTFSGELSRARYALIGDRKNSDLNIYLRSRDEHPSTGATNDWRLFRAFLAAFAFVTGVQPWPFRITYSHDGQDYSDTIRGAVRPPRTSLSALNEAIGLQEPQAFGDAIKAATEYLEPETALTRELIHLLFLFREAGKESVQLEIRILAVCTLLESLIRTIFDKICLRSTKATDAIDRKRFERLKEQLLKRAASLLRKTNAREHARICARIKDAAEFQMQDMFKAVAHELDISWDQTMRPLFSEWKQARNPSAHGRFKPDFEEVSDPQKATEKMFFGLSRIAAGFNMILLKLFGYSGIYCASRLEDKYARL
jgi:hypothetical protein